MGRLGGLLGVSWAPLGVPWRSHGAPLGSHGTSWGSPGVAWGCLGVPWAASCGVLGLCWGRLGVSWCLLGCVWGSFWKSLGNLRKSTEIHMKAIGKSQERRQKVIEKPWDNHWKTIGKSEGNHWNITGKSLYSGVSQGIRLRILAYLRVSSRGLDILTCPGVSWSVLAYPGGVLRNLEETCGVLRSPAASKKPRFPFLCTHRLAGTRLSRGPLK